MIYTVILVVFGVIPLLVLWFAARKWIQRYAGVMLWLALLLVVGGASWERLAIDRIWFYAPNAIVGWRVGNIPLEEWMYYLLDALLVSTLAILLRRIFARFDSQGGRRNEQL